MNILSFSKESKKVELELTIDELIRLCNVLYRQNEYDDILHNQLYGDLMAARDLSQYGHIDNFCFKEIAKCRRKIIEQMKEVRK